MSGGMGLSYSLSPRTQVGLNVEESRLINRYQNAYTTNGTGFARAQNGDAVVPQCPRRRVVHTDNTKHLWRTGFPADDWGRLHRFPDLHANICGVL